LEAVHLPRYIIGIIDENSVIMYKPSCHSKPVEHKIWDFEEWVGRHFTCKM